MRKKRNFQHRTLMKLLFCFVVLLLFCACRDNQAPDTNGDGDGDTSLECDSEPLRENGEKEEQEGHESDEGDNRELEPETEGPQIGGHCTPPDWVCVAKNMGLTCDPTSQTWQGNWCQAKTIDGCEREGSCGPKGCVRNFDPPGSGCQSLGPGYCTATHDCVLGDALLGTPCVSGTPRRCYITKADYFARKILETAVYECGGDGVFVTSTIPYGPAGADCAEKTLTCSYQSQTITLCPCGAGADCTASDGDFE